MLYLAIYPNKRRKTPLVTTPYSLSSYVYYKLNHPEWIIRLEERDVPPYTQRVKNSKVLYTQE